MAIRKPPPNDEQLEIFSAIFTDIVSRDSRETMELPFLSLSKKPRFRPIQYSGPNGIEVTVSGGEPHGIASIFDWDLIIWLLSEIRHAKDKNQSVSRRVRFHRSAFLKDARRHTSGDEYRRLESMIKRLKNTMVSTTIRAKRKRTVMFNWIEYAEIDRDEKGNLRDATIVLPEWLFDAVCDHRLVLTLHRDYFLLTGGIERWLYRIIRKGAGQSTWEWKLRTLYERSGSTQKYKYFSRVVRAIVSKDRLLDYELQLETRNGESFLRATRSKSRVELLSKEPSEPVFFLKLKTETYDAAKRLVPRYDVYAIESEWRAYNEKKQSDIKFPDKAFLAFCRTYAKRNPIPAR